MLSGESVDRRRVTVTAHYPDETTDAAAFDYFCSNAKGIDGGSP
jgi:hypothetical protein